jgi:hypothetical protein
VAEVLTTASRLDKLVCVDQPGKLICFRLLSIPRGRAVFVLVGDKFLLRHFNLGSKPANSGTGESELCAATQNCILKLPRRQTGDLLR